MSNDYNENFHFIVSHPEVVARQMTHYRAEIEQNRIDLEEYRLDVERLRAALLNIRDMGPMTVDDQRWRIAKDVLGGERWTK